MTFGLTPRQHLDNLITEHALFNADVSNARLAINCCVWTNHLPEIIWAAYSTHSPEKVYGTEKPERYRARVISAHPNLGIIRDLCDYAKHGPHLSRQSVQVSRTEQQQTYELDMLAISVGFPSTEITRLVVTLSSGEERWLDALVAGAINFWEREFGEMAL